MKVRALVFHGNRNDQSGLAIMGALAIGHVAFQAMAAERDRGRSAVKSVLRLLVKRLSRLQRFDGFGLESVLRRSS